MLNDIIKRIFNFFKVFKRIGKMTVHYSKNIMNTFSPSVGCTIGKKKKYPWIFMFSSSKSHLSLASLANIMSHILYMQHYQDTIAVCLHFFEG